MSGFDWIIGLVFLISVVVGMWRGFVKEALSIASWIMAFWLAISFCHEAGEFIGGYVNIPTETFRVWAGFSLVFVVTLFAFALLSMLVTKLMLHGPVKTLDRILGVGFGGIRAAAIIIAFMWVIRAMGMSESAWWSNSSLIPKFIPALDWAEARLPESLQRDPEAEPSAQSELIKGVIKENLPDDVLPSLETNEASASDSSQ